MAITAYLNNRDNLHHGEQTLKELLQHNTAISNIEITDANINRFTRVARRYGIDFSLKKDGSSEPPKHLVFFKGRDLDVIDSAFKEFTGLQMGTIKPSVLEQLHTLRDEITRAAKEMVRERVQALVR